MLSLYKVARLCCHVVAQVVEAELVVCTECDVGKICISSCVGVGLVLVDAIYAQAVEHVERSHPLRVTLCKVVVHCHYVHTVAGKRVQEHRQCRHKCLSLTCSHLGNLSLVKDYTAEELYIVMYHVPHGIVAAGLPMVAVYCLVAVDCHKVELRSQVAVEVVCGNDNLLALGESSCAVLYNGKGLRQSLVQCLVKLLKNLFLQFVYLVEYRFSLFELGVFDACLKFRYSGTFFRDSALNLLSQCCRCCTKPVVAELRNCRVCSLYLLYPRLYLSHVAAGLVSEQFAYKFVKTHILIISFIPCCRRMRMHTRSNIMQR